MIIEWLNKNKEAFQPKLIFDIGCADMADSIKYREMYPNAIIHSVECTNEYPNNIENGMKYNIVYHQYAISDKTGIELFYPSETIIQNGTLEKWPLSGSLFTPTGYTGRVNFGKPYEVKTVTLDEFCHKNGVPDFIHMDVQGAEYKVFANSSVIPKVAWVETCEFERYKTGVTKSQFFKLMKSKGYNCIEFEYDALFIHKSLNTL